MSLYKANNCNKTGETCSLYLPFYAQHVLFQGLQCYPEIVLLVKVSYQSKQKVTSHTKVRNDYFCSVLVCTVATAVNAPCKDLISQFFSRFAIQK